MKPKRKRTVDRRGGDRHLKRPKILSWRPSQDEVDWLAAHPELGQTYPARARAVLHERMLAEPIVPPEVPSG